MINAENAIGQTSSLSRWMTRNQVGSPLPSLNHTNPIGKSSRFVFSVHPRSEVLNRNFAGSFASKYQFSVASCCSNSS
jgi:hypothetical protein